AGTGAQLLQLGKACEALVPDVALVGEVKPPIALVLELPKQGLHGVPVRLLGLEPRWPGAAIPAREGHVDRHLPRVALGNEALEPREEGLARAAVLHLDRGDIVLEGGPGRPDANP